MKNFWFLLFASLILMTGCKDDEQDLTQERIMQIASQRVYLNQPAGGPVLFHLTRFEQTERWSHVLYIKHFQYEPGFEYWIRVRITPYIPEPGVIPDGDPTGYDCLEVLSKEKKTSEGLPENSVEE